MELKGKTILILSPQVWGKMFISKHHYAIELAKRGNTVYFLNPPDQQKVARKESIEIKLSDIHPNLFLIEHELFFPYVLKFKVMTIFHWLMRFHVQKLVKKVGRPIDIVWSFDIGNLYSLSFFGKSAYKIFHPVDEPLNKEAIRAAIGAAIIFSVTHEILGKYKGYKVPRCLINHGVTEDFISPASNYTPNSPLRVGYSGNLLRPDIDRDVFLQIIDENPTALFFIWGSYSPHDSNIGGGIDQPTKDFIDQLKRRDNVKLKGAVTSKELALGMREMDVFLICYDVQKDQSKGTNSHKVMEYLGTGKVIISNNITAYKDSDLLEMCVSREHNKELPAIFNKVKQSLIIYNALPRMERRRKTAAENTYSKQVERIERFLN